MKYRAFLPVWASVEYELETDKPLEGEELVEAFLRNAEPIDASLCWQCSNHIDLGDVPVADDYFSADDITLVDKD